MSTAYQRGDIGASLILDTGSTGIGLQAVYSSLRTRICQLTGLLPTALALLSQVYR